MSVTVYTEDEAQQVNDIESFSRNYTLIKAAGGVVGNDSGRVLLIFRRGKWDLPKGKLEDNEPVELCADREIKEETGLTKLQLRKPLIITYHTYTERGKSILKETHWFLFDAPGKQKLKPQTDEDIMKVDWITREDLPMFVDNTYQLIRDVLRSAGF
ncbi:MAG: NUDIX domain-containing protein [Chitinophagaceae bacterium]|nr:NUDIX domain-containing protein [Chitinophagaceae bacterium]